MTREQELLNLINRLQEAGPPFDHVIPVLTKCFNILLDRCRKYNRTNTAYYNTFSHGDAEAFINFDQASKRLGDIAHGGNGSLNCNIPEGELEQPEILSDAINWLLLWGMSRAHRRSEIDHGKSESQ